MVSREMEELRRLRESYQRLTGRMLYFKGYGSDPSIDGTGQSFTGELECNEHFHRFPGEMRVIDAVRFIYFTTFAKHHAYADGEIKWRC